MSSLHTAILNERLHQIQVFLTVGMKVNTRDDLGRTPLMIACFMSNRRRRQMVCELLLDHGADVEVRDKFKRTMLMYACATRNDFLLDQLLQYIDADMNTADLDGNTCLMYAAIEGDVQVMEKILEPLVTYAVDLDVRNRRGLTAYLLALKNGNIDCAKLLQKSGASVQILDTENYWDGGRWLESHYAQRHKYENAQCRRSMRAKSQASQQRDDTKTEIIQRPVSVPRLLSRENQENFQRQCTKRAAKNSRYNEANSATINLDVIALIDDEQTQRNYPKKRIAAWKPGNFASGHKASRGTTPTFTVQGNEPEQFYNKHCVVAGDYDIIVRPPTRLSLRSETLSLTGKSDYGDSVSVSTRSRNRGQKEQLIKIFEEYCINQVPIPPAIPEQAWKIRPLKTNDLNRRASMVPEKPRKRRLSTVRAKVRDIKAEVRTINTMKTILQKN